MVDLMPQTTNKIFGDPSGLRTGTATTGDRTYEVFEPKVDTSYVPEEFKKRLEYEDITAKKYGLPSVRPSISDNEIINKVDSQTSEKEKNLWEHVFGDQARYEDRKHLSNKIRGIWTNALLKARKNIETRIRGELKSQQDRYDYTKGIVDKELQVYDNYQKMYNEETKPEKSRYGAKAVLDVITKINESGESPTESQLTVLREMTKDMPIEVKNTITQEAKKKGLFGIDLLWPDQPEIGTLDIIPKKKVVRTGTKNGRKVVQYEDGSIYYAD